MNGFQTHVVELCGQNDKGVGRLYIINANMPHVDHTSQMQLRNWVWFNCGVGVRSVVVANCAMCDSGMRVVYVPGRAGSNHR